jgi:hypothetical protein
MLQIFQACVKNVRELKKQGTALKRLFNQSVRRNDHSALHALKCLYALLYSSFAEASFLKVIHTPYGFSENEILQIKEQGNLEKKWIKCLDLAFQKIDSMSNKGEIQNKKLIICRYIERYIVEPSQLRNKIAHGQWEVCLNNENTEVNIATTERIKQLDFVKVDILFLIYDKIGQVVEDLIESPHRTHFRDFYYHITELEELISDTASWTFDSKMKVLKEASDRQKEIK